MNANVFVGTKAEQIDTMEEFVKYDREMRAYIVSILAENAKLRAACELAMHEILGLCLALYGTEQGRQLVATNAAHMQLKAALGKDGAK